jgi:putative peptidoglycan lipid II flippase
MAAILWALAIPLAPWLASSAPLPLQVVALGGLVFVGMAVYFGLVHLTGAQPLSQLLRRLRRSPSKA